MPIAHGRTHSVTLCMSPNTCHTPHAQYAAPMITNAKLAALFERMAQLLEVLGENRFKVAAFQRAARALDGMTDQAHDLIDPGDPGKPGDLSNLTAIEGIGKGLAEKIVELVTTGELQEYADLMAKVPAGVVDLLDIPGLGPKTIALFWRKADIHSLDKLKAALEGDALVELPGVGKKKLDNLRKSIAFAESSGGRVRLGQALPVAAWFVDTLGAMKQARQIDCAGSLRRGKETIGDIDIIVAATEKDAAAVSDAFVKLEPVTEVLVHGPTKSSVRTGGDAGGMQVDLRVIDPKNYGAALLYFTGSKEHNIRLRQCAIDRGLHLNEYGLTKQSDNKLVAGKTEADVYKALELAWIPPELREDRDELNLAGQDKLPKLIEMAEIKAELHAHTVASDGHWSIRELAHAAAERGFHTVAVTDHSKSQAQANGLDAKRLRAHIKDIHKVRDEMKDTITILAGSEVDILADGSLDYDDDLLAELDIIVASPHAGLSQPPAKATTRLIKAIENPYVTIIGHPTGRIINRREGLSPDMPAIIDAAKAHGKTLEINAHHLRLDLRDTHARMTIQAGVKLVINTDAHAQDNLDELIYGILTARRAGATKKDVVNCMTASALKKWLARTRQ
jgi:DNA polymerase (family 10)